MAQVLQKCPSQDRERRKENDRVGEKSKCESKKRARWRTGGEEFNVKIKVEPWKEQVVFLLWSLKTEVGGFNSQLRLLFHHMKPSYCSENQTVCFILLVLK